MALYGSDPAQYYAQQQQLQQQKMAQMINMFMQMQQMKQQKQQHGIANQQSERRLNLQEEQQKATAPWYAARTESLMNPDPTTYQRRTSGMTPEQISEFNKFGNLQRPGKTLEQIKDEAKARSTGTAAGKPAGQGRVTEGQLSEREYRRALADINKKYVRMRADIAATFSENISKDTRLSTKSMGPPAMAMYKEQQKEALRSLDVARKEERARLDEIYGKVPKRKTKAVIGGKEYDLNADGSVTIDGQTYDLSAIK